MYALYVEAELETWDEADQRQRRWFDLGVPNSPRSSHSDKCLESVRAHLSPKPHHQSILRSCARLRGELAREGELCEAAWRPPSEKGRRVKKS